MVIRSVERQRNQRRRGIRRNLRSGDPTFQESGDVAPRADPVRRLKIPRGAVGATHPAAIRERKGARCRERR